MLIQHRLAGSLNLADGLIQQAEGLLKSIMPKMGGRRGSSKEAIAGVQIPPAFECTTCALSQQSKTHPAGATLYLAAYLAGYPLFLISIIERLTVPPTVMLSVVASAKQQLQMSLEQHQQLSAKLQEAHITLAASTLSTGHLPLDVRPPDVHTSTYHTAEIHPPSLPWF